MTAIRNLSASAGLKLAAFALLLASLLTGLVGRACGGEVLMPAHPPEVAMLPLHPDDGLMPVHPSGEPQKLLAIADPVSPAVKAMAEAIVAAPVYHCGPLGCSTAPGVIYRVAPPAVAYDPAPAIVRVQVSAPAAVPAAGQGCSCTCADCTGKAQTTNVLPPAVAPVQYYQPAPVQYYQSAPVTCQVVQYAPAAYQSTYGGLTAAGGSSVTYEGRPVRRGLFGRLSAPRGGRCGN